MAKRRKKQMRKRSRKKRRVSKLFISTAAFFTAAVVVVYCIYYVYFKTPYLDLIAIDIIGNEFYDNEYLKKISGIELGEKIFSIDRSSIKEILEKEIYIKEARVLYELPNRVYIEVDERKEKYQIAYNNEYICLDDNGIVLNKYSEKSDLLTIESLTDVIYNIGDRIEFKGIDDINVVFDALEYCKEEFGSETVTKITVAEENSVIIDTEYDTKIRINLKNDLKYQINFAMEIINDRLNNNLTVASDLIDFTKGDSPVYIEDFQMEDNI